MAAEIVNGHRVCVWPQGLSMATEIVYGHRECVWPQRAKYQIAKPRKAFLLNRKNYPRTWLYIEAYTPFFSYCLFT